MCCVVLGLLNNAGFKYDMSLEDFRRVSALAPALFHWQRRLVLAAITLMVLCVIPNPFAAWGMDSLYHVVFIDTGL